MKSRSIAIIAALGLLACGFAQARIIAKTVAYTHEGANLEGVLVYDDAKQDLRPAVLVIPEWWGLNEYARKRAGDLARMGYVAFAADMYGKGKVTTDPKQAQAWAGPFYQKPELMAGRAKAALDQLLQHPYADKNRTAAIGFCFGGSTVLQLVYSGEPLKAAVTFHGGLMPATAEQQKKIKAPLAILHGAKDPLVKREDVDKTRQALDAAGADYFLVEYAGAQHAFTNPDADKYKVPGVAYNEKAARRSWNEMQNFFSEQFSASKK
jgi:dienelactone hydrolase